MISAMQMPPTPTDSSSNQIHSSYNPNATTFTVQNNQGETVNLFLADNLNSQFEPIVPQINLEDIQGITDFQRSFTKRILGILGSSYEVTYSVDSDNEVVIITFINLPGSLPLFSTKYTTVEVALVNDGSAQITFANLANQQPGTFTNVAVRFNSNLVFETATTYNFDINTVGGIHTVASGETLSDDLRDIYGVEIFDASVLVDIADIKRTIIDPDFTKVLKSPQVEALELFVGSLGDAVVYPVRMGESGTLEFDVSYGDTGMKVSNIYGNTTITIYAQEGLMVLDLNTDGRADITSMTNNHGIDLGANVQFDTLISDPVLQDAISKLTGISQVAP